MAMEMSAEGIKNILTVGKANPVSFVFLMCLWTLAIVLLMWFTVCKTPKVEGYADTSATAIMCKQVMEGRPSLCDNVDKAEAAVMAAQKKSQLTGTRDFPVFFQDYNTEMVRKGATVTNEREGYEDPEYYENKYEVFDDLPSENAVDNVKSSDLLNALSGR
jgi:hypothetical protein